MFELADHWIWDSWIADDGATYHLYFLKAPHGPEGPAGRHTIASIGHATSTDLVEWTEQDDALRPGATGWDDLSLWTGSVARGDDGVWRMYYTGLSTAGLGILDQRLGLAESDDLATWRRVGTRPVLEVDPRWYKTLDDGSGASETWRDPFVFRDPDGDGWHMLVTARQKGAPRLADGVLAHARSADMRTWEVQPPLCEPAGFGQIEVPQVRQVDGQPLLVFTCHPEEQAQAHKDAVGLYCTWSVTGDSLTGPWDISRAQPFVEEPALFAAPLVQERDGGWAFVGFRNLEPEGIFEFHIVDPVRVRLAGGRLVRRD